MSARSRGVPTDRALLEALGALGGSAMSGDLVRATGLAERTARAGLARLESQGLVTRSHGSVSLTLAGRGAASPVPTDGGGDALDAYMDDLLPPWQAAWARLLADAVVARWLFPERRSQPCFVAYGPTGTAKTTAVIAVCRLFGLDEVDHLVLLDALAPGEILGRRQRGAGGRLDFVPSPRLSDPLICLDEFANANGEARREALKRLQGDTTLRLEDARVTLAAVPVVVFNPPLRAGELPLLPLAIYRRAVAINTAETVELVRRHEERIAAFLAAPAPRLVTLDSLAPVLDQVPEAVAALLRQPRGEHTPLTAQGQQLWDAAALGCCVLGRLARWADGEDRARAAGATVLLDALICIETIPGTIGATWRDQMGAFPDWLAGLPGADRFTDTMARGRAAAGEIRRRSDARRTERAGADLALVERRGVLRQRMEDARRSIERVPAPYRPEARGLRDGLRQLEERAGDARSQGALDDVAALATPRLGAVQAMRRAIDRARHESEQTRRAQAEMAAQSAAATQTMRERAEDALRAQRAIQRELRQRRGALVKLRRRVQTKRGEDVVAALVREGVVSHEHRQDRAQPLSSMPPRKAVLTALAPVPERVVVDRGGRRWRVGDLAAWGAPGVANVLDAAIDELDRQLAGQSPPVVPSALELLGPLGVGASGTPEVAR